MRLRTGVAMTAILLCSVQAFSDVYVYRVEHWETPIAAARAAFSTVETKNMDQPYVNTHVLAGADTSFFLITLTPNDGADFKLETKAQGVDLYKVLRLDEDGFFRAVIDNSKIFPVSRDWSVKISS